ncbi:MULTISPECIES: ion channel [Rhodanobacter]|uniref:Ion channel n=1 Tax=Rhodanobacter denitrificans TaxID=666685 RepID=M4NIP9_9GAMM|nr:MULTISPECIES: ion channel [Rhodanobacter]AGG89533.1 Ion channel [Rhodanobacter denitrificans]UJJ58079.1 ion channel [Rhodanobacter denitrificans]UJM88409.1 ion channel [Rhodanobacter denitrificans]
MNDIDARASAGGMPRFTRLRWLVRIIRHPSAILLLVQLSGLLLYPFIEHTRPARALFGAFGVLVLGLAISMVRRTRGRAWISAGIALPAVLLNVLDLTLDMPPLRPWWAALEAVFYFYAAGCLIAYMLGDRRATTDELFAAGATFTLLVWAFTYVFVLCQTLQPGCFAAAVNPQAPRSWTELLFLSFALLSSTGIGDVIPITVHARAAASLEMFAGVMYIALVVSRLIGLTLLRRGE